MKLASQASRKFFARFAWLVLAYNLPVILWGAYVRVSFSGDGCGANWPTCGGQFIPRNMGVPMAIEYTHRMTTIVDTVAVAALLIWAFVAYPRQHAVRRFSAWSMVFLLIEALLGAGLVLFRFVAKDQSVGRVWYLSAHLTNTMLLLAALTATAWLAHTGIARVRLRVAPASLFLALGAAVAVSVAGAITALGDTLFPSASLAAGMRQDVAAASSLLLRLRIIHPLLAILAATYILWIASAWTRRARAAALAVIITVVVQLLVGMVNLGLLAPLPLQLLHLLLADLVWIALVLLTLEAAAFRTAAPAEDPASLFARRPSHAEFGVKRQAATHIKRLPRNV